MASGDSAATTDTTREFLRSFSVIDVEESSSESDFDELTPIPEAPGEDFDDDNETDEVDSGAPPDKKVIPYVSLFKQALPFSASQRENCWIPGVAVQVSIRDFERQPALKMLNPNLYTIKVKHADYEWTIYRRYKHFRQLHDSLALFRAKYSLPIPTKDFHQRRATIMNDIKGMKRRQQKTVRLPLRPEPLVSEENIPQRMKQLEEYLQNLMSCKSYRNHPETLKFFEVSHLSFVKKVGIKSKEGLVEKCSGGRRINIQCCGCLQNLHFAGTWNKRWLVVKDNCVMYVRPEDGQVSDVMLMDSKFSVSCGLSNTGAKHGVLIENFSRKLLIKCWTSRKAKEWAEQIQNVAKAKATDYTLTNRFGSFAPARENIYARWFVDGCTYFEAVADALEKATEEIYITDWWLSPQIYLKRPIVDGDKWRLDVILKRKAEQGVKVFVLLYKEVEAALNIKSIYSKQILMSQCQENIKVLRHPDHIPGKGVLLWAHHEKLVIIDQTIAFTGGLDLCYGRWDDENHRMTDLGSISLKPKPSGDSALTNSNLLPEHSSHTEISSVAEDAVSASGVCPSVVVTPATPHRTEPDQDSMMSSIPNGMSDVQASSHQLTKDTDVDTSQPASSEPERMPSELHTSGKTRLEPQKLFAESGSCSSTKSSNSDHSHDHRSSVSSSEPGDSIQWEASDQHEEEESRSGQPIDANVVVKATNPSDEDGRAPGDDGKSGQENAKSVTEQQEVASDSLPQFGSRRGGGDSRKTLVRKQSIIVDTEGFSDSALEEINQSMQPFKDIHGDNFRSQACDNDRSDNVHVSSGGATLGFQDFVDKEIICCAEADESPKSGRKVSPSSSPARNKKVNNTERGGARASKLGKASHLWGRRTKNKQLELVMPSNNGTYRQVGEGGDRGGETQLATEKVSPKRGKKKAGKISSDGGTEKNNLGVEEVKLRANSDSSEASKASDSDLIMADRSSQLSTGNHKEGKGGGQSATPSSTSSPHGAFSFANAASAMSAFRKMMHRKEQNNNEDGEPTSPSSNLDPSSAARRRWKMIFNVSKFETIVRAPQVPERLDESLFYQHNVPHPKTRRRLVKSFKEGVDKLTRQGRRDSTELQRREARGLLFPHTDSEEDILERGLLGSTKFWIGKDYVNFIYKDFVSLEQPFEDFIDRTQCPRMPWHDIGCVVYGKAARDLARHFIGRWNFTKLEKCKKNADFPLLIPKTSTKCSIPNAIKDITFEVKAQILRSSSGWSAGIGENEGSIHEAYEHCIENARDYIYIENQFFITQVGASSSVSNRIGNALYKRILRAYRSSSDFKVYVVMPLLPAFEGEFGTSTGAALQAVTHWNYSSICRGGNSLMERLAKEVPDPNKYIVFCGLRTWDKLNDQLMTELIYVHSKLMIVDDDTVIIGSANINDRSLLGPRDSEIAVMFEDVHKVDVTVNGKRYHAGKFASSLRWTIFREHLGIINDPDFVDLTDITSDSFYKDVWIRRAAVNTTCYDKVFRCLPTDNVKNFAELRQYQTVPPLAKTNEEESMTWLRKVKGNLVLIPLQFLREESLTPKVGQKEALLPTYLWT